MSEEDRSCARPGCDVTLRRKEGETAQNFRNRRYCDKSCAARHQKKRRGGNNRAFLMHTKNGG